MSTVVSVVLVAVGCLWLGCAIERRTREPRQFCHFASGWADSSHTALKCILWWDGKRLVEIP
jgi:hypothetical protein